MAATTGLRGRLSEGMGDREAQDEKRTLRSRNMSWEAPVYQGQRSRGSTADGCLDKERGWILAMLTDYGPNGSSPRRARVPTAPGSDLASCLQCPDEADQRSAACRATPGQPDDLNTSHVLREASNRAHADNHEHRQDGQIWSRASHTHFLSRSHSRLCRPIRPFRIPCLNTAT